MSTIQIGPRVIGRGHPAFIVSKMFGETYTDHIFIGGM